MNSNQRLINHINMAVDILAIWASYFLTGVIRYDFLTGVKTIDVYDWQYVLMAFVYSVMVVAIFYMAHMYGTYRFSKYTKEMFSIAVINGTCIMFIMAFLFMTKVIDFSRAFLIIWYCLSCIILVVKRVLFRSTLGYLYYSKISRNVVVIGSNILAYQYMENLKRAENVKSIVLKGYVGKEANKQLEGYLGTYELLSSIINDNNIDELIVAMEPDEINIMPLIFHVADKEGIGIRIVPFYNNYLPKNAKMTNVGDIKLINVRVTPLDNLLWSAIKRIIDICGAVFGLIILSPIFAVTAVGVKLSSPGPVFFAQDRIGRYKKPFKMYKFRSMRVNQNETTGWSTNTDSRKTPFGSFIRKFSIDELPQLFNVLKGDMSLIGPRPEVPFYVRQFKEEVPLYLIRHQVRPGMTGWAQVHGLRGDTSIEDRVKYDLWYIENWSLWLDIKILVKTVFGGLKNSEEIVKKEKEHV